MRASYFALGLFSLGTVILWLGGCSTTEPGATDTLGSYSTNVDGAPDKVTAAAAKACEDLKLTSIASNGTAVDGKVTAKTAAGDDVSITISQAGDKISKVTIRVGATGDEAVSKQLVDRINSHMSWI